MICPDCKKEMDQEEEEFCGDYNIDICLKCCGKDWKNNAKAGIYYHTSMVVCDDSQSHGSTSEVKA